MQIILKQMTLINFKGIRNQKFQFSPNINIISGDNAVGKTTVLDAFLWCLFGKDSTDRQAFEIKTVDENGNTIPRLDHEVTITLIVSSKEIELRRVLVEKWTKIRGSTDAQFTGNETEYYWNNVPLKMADYNVRISELIDQELFKLITNVTYFHSLNWEKRRDILFGLAGEVSEADILNQLTEKELSTTITNILNSGKYLEDSKLELAAKKKKIREAIKDIPSRIDEAERSKPVPVDVADVEKQITNKEAEKTGLQKQIDQIESQLLSESERLKAINQANTDRLKALYDLKSQYEHRKLKLTHDIQAEYKDPAIEIADQKKKLAEVDSQVVDTEKKIDNFTTQIADLNSQTEKLRKDWHAVNSEKAEFEDHQFSCPTCKREMEQEDILLKKTEFTENFNKDKARNLEQISNKGIALKKEITNLEKRKEDAHGERDFFQKKLVEIRDILFNLEVQTNQQPPLSEIVEKTIDSDPDLKLLTEKIAEAEKAESEKAESEIQDTLLAKKAELKANIVDIDTDLTALKVQLGTVDSIERINARINELKEQESTMSQEMANLEGIEFAILQYEKIRVDYIEQRINSLFKLVTFRMFETQINGGEKAVCKTLIEGVPFEDANNAARINAGLDIINALCKHNNVYAPIFIDNAESINEVSEVESQMIRLEVSHEPELSFTTVEKLESILN